MKCMNFPHIKKKSNNIQTTTTKHINLYLQAYKLDLLNQEDPMLQSQELKVNN